MVSAGASTDAYLTYSALPIAFPASRRAVTVVHAPPSCVRSPAVPFAGVKSCGGLGNVTLIAILLCSVCVVKDTHCFLRRISRSR